MAECAFQACIYHGDQNKDIVLDNLEGITYHLFPKDPTMREKWIKQMNQDNWQPTHSSALCSLHFNKDYFVTDARGVNQLKAGAIPTEFEFVFKREMDMGDDDEVINMVCCAYKCGNSYAQDPSLSFHTFPLDQPEQCAQWLTAMNCESIDAAAAVLCSEHFEPDCFLMNEDGERMLIADSVPTLFILPENDETDMMEQNDMPMESEDTSDAIDPETAMESSNPNNFKCEITEDELDLIRRHDDVVTALVEEGQRLIEVIVKKNKLEKKKNDLCYLLDACVHNTPLDRNKIKSIRHIIKEVEETFQQTLVRCLEPCVVSSDIIQE